MPSEPDQTASTAVRRRPASDTIVYVAPPQVRRSAPVTTEVSPRAAISQVLVSGELVTVGRWRCPVASPFFTDSGPPGRYLCVFPRSGVWIRHEGNRAFVADPTVVTFYNPGQRYTRAPLDSRGDHCDWFGIADSVVAEILAAHDALGQEHSDLRFSFSHGPSDRAAYVAQRAVYDHVCGCDDPDALFIEETMLAVADRVVGLACRASASAAKGAAARRRGAELAEVAKAVLSTGFAKSSPLSVVAERVGVSPFHLARVFREHTGRSLHQHRTELRMRAALEQVADPAVDLMSVALDLGYSSHSHFTAVFRRTFGAPPRAIRSAGAPLVNELRAGRR